MQECLIRVFGGNGRINVYLINDNAIISKSSDFQEYEPISSNGEGYIIRLLSSSIKSINYRRFHWVKITLREITLFRSWKCRLQRKSKNNNYFNITYKFDWQPSTFKSLVARLNTTCKRVLSVDTTSANNDTCDSLELIKESYFSNAATTTRLHMKVAYWSGYSGNKFKSIFQPHVIFIAASKISRYGPEKELRICTFFTQCLYFRLKISFDSNVWL